ncbi:MAG: archaeal proteasome endopeptidase complex subunit alpha [Candidatus Lokiarchaeota archaeon]|nr:archaeal proteasome endopeptidase complex subunit alpha [Candidatus Lokiarchaeota archaeon]
MFGGPEMSGYDQAITIFSPDGRLFQVEYANEAIKQGTTAIGIKCPEGVVLLAEKRVSKLQLPETAEKIFIIDEHIGATIAGLTADASVLVDHGRVQAQISRLTYDEPMDVKALVRKICDLKQTYTHNAGVRPFGVAFLIAGVDSGPRLYMTAPSGAFTGYQAQAIGSGAQTVREKLEKEYKPDLTLDASIILGLKCLKEVTQNSLDPMTVDMAIVKTADKKFKVLNNEEIKAYIEKVQ